MSRFVGNDIFYAANYRTRLADFHRSRPVRGVHFDLVIHPFYYDPDQKRAAAPNGSGLPKLFQR